MEVNLRRLYRKIFGQKNFGNGSVDSEGTKGTGRNVETEKKLSKGSEDMPKANRHSYNPATRKRVNRCPPFW